MVEKRPFPWRMVIYASIMYVAIFALAFGYKAFIITPTQHLLLSTTTTASQKAALNTSIVSVGLSQASSSASNQNTIITLTIEIILISIFAVAEMKWHLISRMLKIWWLRDIIAVAPFILLFVAAIYVAGWELGIALAVVGLVIFGGMWLVISKLAKKYMLSAIMILLSYGIAFLLLTPIINLASSNHQTVIIGTLICLAGLLACALVTIKFLGERKNLKNILNITAALSCITFSIYFGMIITTMYLVILLAIFAIYDFIAVFITKHMQFMASKLVGEMVPAMFMWGDEKELNDKLKKLGEGKPLPPPKPGAKKSTATMLGTGDICLIAAAFCSAIFYTPKIASFMLIGAIVGITMCGYSLSTGKFKQGIPALIFLVPCVLIFAGIGLIL